MPAAIIVSPVRLPAARNPASGPTSPAVSAATPLSRCNRFARRSVKLVSRDTIGARRRGGAAMAFDPETLRHRGRPHGLPFRIAKLGHVVLNVSDIPRSVAFYTGLLGFAVSDVYPDEMMPGGMVFMRCN